ncbi:class I SAM-dependent methyltransferase [Rhizobium hidalgonense]|uniref:Class I SAM-dependent methyltransferase n=1 Tax=Rhizobium hidalgonense TaxID=1538159 RepID=A0AAJ2LMF6_9HYPH|nr:class I SAM-dependent methyltransferase [Rhizobium hidalgonense]MDR9777570.1 class I SAM-dependent methyltransferase [Rhizobium hidalgonense]MDR9823905.1 class I SAM-dependent methyltransferase [Rhizobium hidalgonense]
MADASKQDVLKAVADYYSDKLAEHGQSARGVDWNGEESQTLRFEQLSKIIDRSKEFSLNDLGCGYGGYFDYLGRKHDQVYYSGLDLSGDMIAAAQQRFAGDRNARFVVAGEPDLVADYGIASGIFNVRLDSTDDIWQAHVLRTLDVLDNTSRHGFAFNCLTSYSDPDKMRDYLYYANPGQLFDHCKRHYSRNVALLHDYGLYEFTILVRKS